MITHCRPRHRLVASSRSTAASLLLHVFDLDDEAAFIAHYKARYERPLEGDLRMTRCCRRDLR